jgi:hypothetical protein
MLWCWVCIVYNIYIYIYIYICIYLNISDVTRCMLITLLRFSFLRLRSFRFWVMFFIYFNNTGKVDSEASAGEQAPPLAPKSARKYGKPEWGEPIKGGRCYFEGTSIFLCCSFPRRPQTHFFLTIGLVYGYYCLLWETVLRSGIVMEEVDLTKQDHTLFGRDETICDVILGHPSISRQHAIVQCGKYGDSSKGKVAGAFVYDLGSTHGTHVNRRMVKPKSYHRYI